MQKKKCLSRRRRVITSAELKEFLKGKRIKLDCGHTYCLHPFSNTLVLTAKGKTACHNCYD